MKRYFIAVGCPNTLGLRPLKQVGPDVEKLTRFFTSQGYERVLSDRIRANTPAQTILNELGGWFASPERSASDRVVLYFAGHGDSRGRFGHHYLLTADTSLRLLSRTAVRASDLIEAIAEGEDDGDRPERVLILLDVCYAGAGAQQIASQLTRGVASRSFPTGLWIIASADRDTEAGDGAFVRAFVATLDNSAYAPAGPQEVVEPAALVTGMNEWLEHTRISQSVEFYATGVRGRTDFIMNPRSDHRRVGRVLQDDFTWQTTRGSLSAGGVAVAFVGRIRAVAKAKEILSGSEQRRLGVVTGDPGSGKSSVLGHVANALQHESRTSFDMVQLSLRGQRISDVRDLIELHRNRFRGDGAAGWCIVLDALDEAADPAGMARFIATELAPTGLGVLVGSRRVPAVNVLSTNAVVVDLDAPQFFDPADMEEYIRSRLTAFAPHLSDAERRSKVSAISRECGTSFLLAQLFTRQADWVPQARSQSESLEQAFAKDLERFGEADRRKILNLLVPLAFAHGVGLPQKRIWSGLASEISGSKYGNDDIEWLKGTAPYFIVQDSADGEAVYRLFHEQFSYWLQCQVDATAMRERIANVLLQSARGSISQNWACDGIEPYVRRHLAEHMLYAGRIEELAADPGLLLSLKRASLLATLPSARSEQGINGAASFSAIYADGLARTDGPALLRLSALLHGATELASALEVKPHTYNWWPTWFSGLATVPSTYLGTLSSKALSVFVVDDARHGSVVIAATTTELSAWRARDGEFIGTMMSQATIVTAGPAAEGIGVRVAFATEAGILAIADIESSQILVSVSLGDAENPTHIETLDSSTRDGRSVLVTGDSRGNLAIWDSRDLSLIQSRDNAHKLGIQIVRVVSAPGRAAFIASYSYPYNGNTRLENTSLKLWDYTDLTRRSFSLTKSSAIKQLATGQIEDEPVVYVSWLTELEVFSADGASLRLSDLTLGLAIQNQIGHRFVGERYGALRLFDHDELNINNAGDYSTIPFAKGSLVSLAFKLDGADCVAAIDNRRVLIYRLSALASRESLLASLRRNGTVGIWNYCGSALTRFAIAHNSRGLIYSIDSQTGKSVQPSQAAEAAGVLEFATFRGEPIACIANDHCASFWRLPTLDEALSKVELPFKIERAILFSDRRGRDLFAAVVFHSSERSVLVYELGPPLRPLAGFRPSGWKEKGIFALSYFADTERTLLGIGSRRGASVWDLEAFEAQHERFLDYTFPRDSTTHEVQYDIVAAACLLSGTAGVTADSHAIDFFSHGGSCFLLSADDEGGLAVGDLSTQKVVARLKVNGGTATSVGHIAANGRVILFCVVSGHLWLYDDKLTALGDVLLPSDFRVAWANGENIIMGSDSGLVSLNVSPLLR
jgi:WD40 repeat protein